MTIEQDKVIDIIGLDEKKGFVYLTISDHLAWGEDETKLLILQNKINAYLAYLESGEIYEAYPQARSLNPVISLVSREEANEKGHEFLNRVVPIIEEAGFSFEWSVFHET